MSYDYRLIAALAAGLLLPAAPLAAQTRLWAAQTGPDLVTLAWDSIPGAAAYQIYVGLPDAEHRPATSLGGSGRQTVLFGMQRLTAGIYLVAKAADGRTLQQLPFNPVARAMSFTPIKAPSEVRAEATSATEVTLSWTPAPGATAYFILRAAGGSGYRPLCQLCSTTPQYVDRDVQPGFEHSYLVAAIFPSGTSRRTASNAVTPGARATTESAGATSPTHAATPVGQPPASSGPLGVISGTAQQVASTIGTVLGGPAATPPGGTHAATPVGQTPAPSGPLGVIAGTAQQVGQAVGSGLGGIAQGAGNLLTTNTPGPAVTPTGPTRVTPSTPCKLDYQRADNMWAAFGRPDGPLGTETISLTPGQNKVFITDWAYEKKRNDGSNYYGSHLRIATNPGARTVRLQLRTTTPAGLVVFARTGTNTFWIRMAAGESQRVQADLMEVFCEN